MTITDKQKAFLLKKGVKVEYGMSKEEASKLIDEIINKPKANQFHKTIEPQETVTVEKVGEWSKPKFDTSSYYVAYAKDLCIAMLEHTKEPTEIATLMNQAVQCIKAARKEF